MWQLVNYRHFYHEQQKLRGLAPSVLGPNDEMCHLCLVIKTPSSSSSSVQPKFTNINSKLIAFINRVYGINVSEYVIFYLIFWTTNHFYSSILSNFLFILFQIAATDMICMSCVQSTCDIYNEGALIKAFAASVRLNKQVISEYYAYFFFKYFVWGNLCIYLMTFFNQFSLVSIDNVEMIQ